VRAFIRLLAEGGCPSAMVGRFFEPNSRVRMDMMMTLAIPSWTFSLNYPDANK
jgi:hypothetical protein